MEKTKTMKLKAEAGGGPTDGSIVTIAGFGLDAKGRQVVDGFNPLTKRRCRVVTQQKFILSRFPK